MDTLEQTLKIATPNEESTSPTRSKRWLTILGWVGIGLFFLTFFTLSKLPEQRLKSYIDSQIAAVLGQKGISFSSKSGGISLLFGLSYTMNDITLQLPPPSPPGHIDRVDLSPSLLPLLIGRTGGSFTLYLKEGVISGSFSSKGNSVQLSYHAKKFELGKLGILPTLAGVQANAILDGDGKFSGDFAIPNTWDGKIDLSLTKGVIDPQVIAGFSIPRLNISEGIVEITLDKGKGKVKTLRLGKPGNASDDIHASMTGDLVLAKQWDGSTMNLRTTLSFSEAVLKAFVLLDAILGAHKQPDGSYTFMLVGPLESPMPAPIAPGN